MVERLLRFIGAVPADKVLHFACGAVLSAVGLCWGLGGAVILPLAAGLAKEVYDGFHPAHTADAMDLLTTVLGAVPVWAGFIAGRFA